MLIEKAREIMLLAHQNQVDKAGVPYWHHPEAVAEFCHTEKEKIVALLHDVLEDSTFEIKDIAGIFSDDIVEAVTLLTHDADVDYMDYIKEIKKNSLARAVKISDLRQNISLNRLDHLTLEDAQRAEKYARALIFLLS